MPKTKKRLTPRRKAPKEVTLRQALDQIDRYLCIPTLGRRLCGVLSALRGPDEEKYAYIKGNSTGVIRAEAFPRLAKLKSGECPWTMTVGSKNVTVPSSSGISCNHFRSHLITAAEVLNLTTQLPK